MHKISLGLFVSTTTQNQEYIGPIFMKFLEGVDLDASSIFGDMDSVMHGVRFRSAIWFRSAI